MNQKECYDKYWNCEDHSCPYFMMCRNEDFNAVKGSYDLFGIVYYKSVEA